MGSHISLSKTLNGQNSFSNDLFPPLNGSVVPAPQGLVVGPGHRHSLQPHTQERRKTRGLYSFKGRPVCTVRPTNGVQVLEELRGARGRKFVRGELGIFLAAVFFSHYLSYVFVSLMMFTETCERIAAKLGSDGLCSWGENWLLQRNGNLGCKTLCSLCGNVLLMLG